MRTELSPLEIANTFPIGSNSAATICEGSESRLSRRLALLNTVPITALLRRDRSRTNIRPSSPSGTIGKISPNDRDAVLLRYVDNHVFGEFHLEDLGFDVGSPGKIQPKESVLRLVVQNEHSILHCPCLEMANLKRVPP